MKKLRANAQEVPSRRVLHVITSLDGADGVGVHIRLLTEHMQKLGWEVAIASRSVTHMQINADYLKAKSIPHFQIPFPKFLPFKKSLLGGLPQSYRRLAAAVSTYRPSIVHLHGFGTSPFYYPMKLVHGVPFVSTPHITPSPYAAAQWGRLGPLRKPASRMFGDRIIAISEEVRDATEHVWKVPRERISLVHHGVDGERFRPPTAEEKVRARASFGVQADEFPICMVAWLHPAKGHDILVKAVARLRSSAIPVVALCAGDGSPEEWQAVVSLAKKLNVDRHVRLLGYTPSRDVLWASEVSVLLSRKDRGEGFPISTVEAMMCGVVPVRTPAAGARSQIKDGYNGYIVPFEDDAALASVLGRLCHDAKHREDMSARSRQLALEHFSLEDMIRKTLDVYEGAINP